MTTKAKFLVGLAVFSTVPMGLSMAYGKGPWTGLLWVAALLGAVGATFFVLMFGSVYLLANAAKGVPQVPLEEGEQILTTVPASHLEGFISHGGSLRVTTRRIVFTPHRFNFKLQPRVIAWADVQGIALEATAEFALLQLATAVLATTTPAHGLHAAVGRSDVLRVRHGQTESRFVIMPDKALLDWLSAAMIPAR